MEHLFDAVRLLYDLFTFKTHGEPIITEYIKTVKHVVILPTEVCLKVSNLSSSKSKIRSYEICYLNRNYNIIFFELHFFHRQTLI